MHKCIPYGEEWEEKPLPPGGAGRCGHCLPTDDNEGAKRKIATGTVAVPDKIIGLTLILDFIDRGHSLCSLAMTTGATQDGIRRKTPRKHTLPGILLLSLDSLIFMLFLH